MNDFICKEQQDLDLMMTCAYGAVREHFSHLTIEEIINPPRQFADAFTALHMATCILCEEFGLSRVMTARLQTRFKSAVFVSARQIRERRQTAVFDRVYMRVAARALVLYAQEAERLAA